jgi:hypothetical protein
MKVPITLVNEYNTSMEAKVKIAELVMNKMKIENINLLGSDN